MDNEERNYCCLVLLLSRVGLVKLREFFINEWNSLGTLLPWTNCSQNGGDLLKKRKFKPLDYEKSKVKSGDTTTWDLSLFVKALLNTKPPLVPKSNKALVDGLSCLKDARNTLCHTTSGRVKISEFTKLKGDVCKGLVLIGASPNDIKKVEEDIQQPWSEVLSLLSNCTSQDKDIINGIVAIHRRINQLREDVKEGHEELKQGQLGLQQGQQEIKQGQSGLQQGQQEVRQCQSGLQQGQQEIKQGHSGLQQGQQEIKQGQSGLQQGLEQIIKEIQSPPTASSKSTKLSSQDAEVFSEKLKLSIKAQTEFQPKLISSHSVPSIRTDEIFTSLMIQRGWKPIEMKATGRMEQLAQFNTPKFCLIDRCQDIFINPDQGKANPKSIQVIGKPGIGKSLFCQRLCRDWADGVLFQSNECNTKTSDGFDFVFLITFRQLNLFENKNVNFRDVLNHCSVVDEHSVINESLFEHLIEHQEKILFILDGYDEYSHRSRIYDCQFEQNYLCNQRLQMPVAALISKLLRKKVFSGSVVMVTSRPTEANELGGIHKDALVEIAGFSTDQLRQFIEKYFKKEEIKNAARDHIVNNANLLSLAHIPMLCYLMCFCLEWHIESGKHTSLPTTITSLYSEVVEIFELKHHCKSQYRARDVPESYNVPHVIKETVQKLSQFAAATYLSNKVVFNDADIRDYGLTEQEINDLKSCGLITCGPSFKTGPFTFTREYCFSHLTLHEYFAALGFINSGTIPTLEGDGNEMVLQFCAGLLYGKEDGERRMKEMIVPYCNMKKGLLAAKLLREYGDKALGVTFVQKYHSSLCDNNGVLFGESVDLSDNTDCEAFTWFLGCINELCALKKDQTSSSSQVVSIKELSCYFDSVSDAGQLSEPLMHNSCPIVTLDLTCGETFFVTLHHSQSNNIFAVLPSTQITELQLSGAYIGDKDVLHLSAVLPLTQINTLNLNSHNFTDEGLSKLSGVLPLSCINNLHLNSHNFTDEGLSKLSGVLPLSCINNLHLNSHNFTDEGLSKLSGVLPLSCITNLYLRGYGFTDKGLLSLSRVLPSTLITTLHLMCHGFTDEVLSTLKRVIPSTRITTLRLLTHTGKVLSLTQ